MWQWSWRTLLWRLSWRDLTCSNNWLLLYFFDDCFSLIPSSSALSAFLRSFSAFGWLVELIFSRTAVWQTEEGMWLEWEDHGKDSQVCLEGHQLPFGSCPVPSRVPPCRVSLRRGRQSLSTCPFSHPQEPVHSTRFLLFSSSQNRWTWTWPWEQTLFKGMNGMNESGCCVYWISKNLAMIVRKDETTNK